MMDILALDGVRGADVSFNFESSVKQAQRDFMSLAATANVIVKGNAGLFSLQNTETSLADVLVVPFATEKNISTFPANLVKVDDPSMYVAAVCYKNGAPVDVLMFNSSLFKFKSSPLSFFKWWTRFIRYDKEAGQYSLVIKDIKHRSMSNYGFGNVIRQLQRRS